MRPIYIVIVIPQTDGGRQFYGMESEAAAFTWAAEIRQDPASIEAWAADRVTFAEKGQWPSGWVWPRTTEDGGWPDAGEVEAAHRAQACKRAFLWSKPRTLRDQLGWHDSDGWPS